LYLRRTVGTAWPTTKKTKAQCGDDCCRDGAKLQLTRAGRQMQRTPPLGQRPRLRKSSRCCCCCCCCC
jgi:hypothetical protein